MVCEVSASHSTSYQGVSSSILSHVEMARMNPKKLLNHFRKSAMKSLEQQLEEKRLVSIFEHAASQKCNRKRRMKVVFKKKDHEKDRMKIEEGLKVHYKKMALAKENAKKILLTLRFVREQSSDYYIPDEDRAVVNEAIRAHLDLKLIDLLLQDYPRACESGGCVDHLDHPIHTACSEYRHVVPIILKHAPECASQRNSDGKSALEIFLENGREIDFTAEELASTGDQLCKLDPNVMKETRLTRRQSLREKVLLNGLIPYHIKSSTLNETLRDELEGLIRKVL